MAEDTLTTTGIARHGATRLPSVDVDSFNIELKDDEGFLAIAPARARSARSWNCASR